MSGTQAASAALMETQARRLSVLAARVDEARLRLPRQSDTVWRGPAAFSYQIALGYLTAEFSSAYQRLVSAATASRRAAAMLMATANG